MYLANSRQFCPQEAASERSTSSEGSASPKRSRTSLESPFFTKVSC